MSRYAILLLLLPVAACSTVPREWEKPGADSAVAHQDLGDCRKAATAEAFRMQTDQYPFGFHRSRPFYGGFHRSWAAFPDYGSDRLYNEQRLTAFCMNNKGYALTPVAPERGQPETPPPKS